MTDWIDKWTYALDIDLWPWTMTLINTAKQLKLTRKSHKSAKTNAGTVFCAWWPWPLTFWSPNKWVPGLIMEHAYVKFGDLSCIGFWDLSWKIRQKHKRRCKHITPVTAVRWVTTNTLYQRQHWCSAAGKLTAIISRQKTSDQKISKKGCIKRGMFHGAQFNVITTSWEHCSWLQQSRCNAVIDDWMIPFAAYTAAETPSAFQWARQQTDRQTDGHDRLR